MTHYIWFLYSACFVGYHYSICSNGNMVLGDLETALSYFDAACRALAAWYRALPFAPLLISTNPVMPRSFLAICKAWTQLPILDCVFILLWDFRETTLPRLFKH